MPQIAATVAEEINVDPMAESIVACGLSVRGGSAVVAITIAHK
jgi:uncharacterized membrane protein YadS